MPNHGEPVHPYNRHAPVIIGVLAALCATFVVFMVWRNEQTSARRETMAALNSEADIVQSQVHQRLDALELIMRGGVSMMSGDDLPTPEQWDNYVEGLDVMRRYESMVGLGFSPYVDRVDLARFQREWLDRTGQQIEIRPWGVRDAYAPVLYFAPQTRETQQMVGHDLYVEPRRHEAMQRAMESGRPWLSDPLELLVDAGHGLPPSYVFYAPLYRHGEMPGTLAARRAQMVGWVYIPFRMYRFINLALKPLDRRLKLRISDATDPRHVVVLTEDSGLAGQVFNGPIGRRIEAYGREWRLEFFDQGAASAPGGLWVLGSGLPLALATGLIAFLLARTQGRAQVLARDMTRAHARSEALFRSAMVYSSVGMALLDENGDIVEVNPAFTRLFERDIGSLRGKHFGSMLDRGSIGLVEGDGEGGMRREIRRFARDNGELRHIALVYGEMPPADGVDISMLVQAEDISERIRGEARIRALNRTLEQRVDARTRELSEANHQLESFAYTVSHDLRAPLRAIDGFSRLLWERHVEALDEAARGYLARIREGAHRMDDLIGAILKISRVSRGELQRRPLDLSALAAEMVEELRASEPGRAVEVDIAPGIQAEGDPSLVRILMQNLVGNAWKFTRDREPAHICFGRDAEGRFFVEDDGVGFDEAYAGKLFQPFQRLHTESEFPGHGIGLATVRRIVERHGGRLQATAEVGRGARFTFTLPEGAGEGHDDPRA